MTNLTDYKMQEYCKLRSWDKSRWSPVVSSRDWASSFDYNMSTKPVVGYRFDTISAFPSAKENPGITKCLQRVQENITVRRTERPCWNNCVYLQAYLQSSSQLLKKISAWCTFRNTETFEKTVFQLIQNLQLVNGADYLADKLLRRFEESPLAIP